MDFKEELKERSARAEQVMERYLPGEEGQQHLLREAMNYSMRSGGKRLRPVLMALAYELFGGHDGTIEPFMAAIEMIHTHSLIHDDLPAIDNDTWRRGKHTCHVAYGEAVAILAGDGLLNLAYETMAEALLRSGEAGAGEDPGEVFLRMKRCANAFQILAEKTGHKGMLGGQSVDVIMDGKPLSKEQLQFIFDLKTGALLEASLLCGAVLAGAGEADLERMRLIGHKIGLAFQIRDDMLDVIGNQEELGKDIGSDEKNNKTTYVTLYGLEKAGQDVERLTNEAVALLDEIPGEKAFLRELLLALTLRQS